MARVWIHQVAPEESEEQAFTAVALKQVGRGQYHIGIVHRRDRGLIDLLHLAWHHDLKNEPLRPGFVVVDPDLSPPRARSVAAMCRLVWQRHQSGGLPYGIKYTEGRFDARTADLLLEGQTCGLTCATFVLALYASCAIPLLAVDTWKTRSDDVAWHRRVVEILRQTGASLEHLESVEAEVGCARFRPVDVAGGCLVDERPASFEAATTAAVGVLEILRTLSKDGSARKRSQ